MRVPPGGLHTLACMLDSNLSYHYYMLNFVRRFLFIFQNTVEGRIAYFPVVGRLSCDSSSADHRGFWELNGYGLLGIYKFDWTAIGGKWNSIFYRDKKNNLMPSKLKLQYRCIAKLMQRMFNHYLVNTLQRDHMTKQWSMKL